MGLWGSGQSGAPGAAVASLLSERLGRRMGCPAGAVCSPTTCRVLQKSLHCAARSGSPWGDGLPQPFWGELAAWPQRGS